MQRLTDFEREKIEYLVRCRLGIREIGRLLKRDHAVISREIRRNTGASGRYTAVIAKRETARKARLTNTRLLDTNPYLEKWVVEQLKKDLSPEQIAGRLKDAPPKKLRDVSVSHETIYQWIYEGEGRWMHLYPHLRRGKKKRQRRYARKPRLSRIPKRISIHERPEEINKRERFGDWESDTMLGRGHRHGVSVQYERRSQLVRIHRVRTMEAKETRKALEESINSLPRTLWKSITFDNGNEGRDHDRIKRQYGVDTFFCDAFASWQKGGVENMNGLIRQYIPRGTDMDTMTDAAIKRIENRLNNRPRKSLNYKTPNEVIREYLTKSGALNP
jgi:transposase, IS30 family